MLASRSTPRSAPFARTRHASATSAQVLSPCLSPRQYSHTCGVTAPMDRLPESCVRGLDGRRARVRRARGVVAQLGLEAGEGWWGADAQGEGDGGVGLARSDGEGGRGGRGRARGGRCCRGGVDEADCRPGQINRVYDVRCVSTQFLRVVRSRSAQHALLDPPRRSERDLPRSHTHRPRGPPDRVPLAHLGPEPPCLVSWAQGPQDGGAVRAEGADERVGTGGLGRDGWVEDEAGDEGAGGEDVGGHRHLSSQSKSTRQGAGQACADRICSGGRRTDTASETPRSRLLRAPSRRAAPGPRSPRGGDDTDRNVSRASLQEEDTVARARELGAAAVPTA
ncbi:hypothetical protein DMC30DRAFT_402971 [Rhodotorula diobovata]|uniref:Uncharacterized protein n=1 Tax=Rhodotorula diobovata TaxID=5288 RepID=A0A5C5FQJ8_9BASI|nr:hypothetical protein DMC30DRAFT_402971 [Rhodotorula diobovata]